MSQSHGMHGLAKVTDADLLKDAIKTIANANVEAVEAALATIDDAVSGKAPASHAHSASDITSGVLSVERGGTGKTSLQATRNAMGLGNTTGALPVANGGTGASTAAAAASAIVGGQAIAPKSVAATGAVSGASVSDSAGSLAELRNSLGAASAKDVDSSISDATSANVPTSAAVASYVDAALGTIANGSY